MLPVTICHFIKDYQHRKKIRCAAVTESQCLCLSYRTGRYALHTLLSILSHHMVPTRIIAICISEMSYISQTERVKCRVEGCPFRYEKSLLRKNYKQHLIDLTLIQVCLVIFDVIKYICTFLQEKIQKIYVAIWIKTFVPSSVPVGKGKVRSHLRHSCPQQRREIYLEIPNSSLTGPKTMIQVEHNRTVGQVLVLAEKKLELVAD